MDLLWIIAAASVFAQAHSEDEQLNISNFNFSESASNEIMKLEWSAFGKTNQRARENIYRNKLPPVVVNTPMGTVSGLLSETARGFVKYGAFYGMPYAKPPVDALRFAAPVPAEPWKGVYDASYERPSCFQFAGDVNNESEDCLYINVYTPNFDLKQEPLPVMVFIYGGAFITGSSNSSIYSPDFLVDKGVILVTFNYRIGVLGFLSLQNEAVPGNAGLKDQALALQWIKNNIASFGGNPNRVTLFGESAGSASINFHMLSPISKGLFHGVIMESGTAINPWAFVAKTEVLRLSRALARKVGCPSTCMDEMLSCLRKVPASKLTNEQQGALKIEDVLRLRPFAFVPTEEPKISGAFLTEPPNNMLLEGRFNSVPTIIGSNSAEGLIILPVLKHIDPVGVGVFLVGIDLSLFYPYELRAQKNRWQRLVIHSKIKNFYFGAHMVTIFKRDKLLNLITDSAFTMPIQHTAALLANSTSPVYNYLFSYSGGYGFFKSKLDLGQEEGVCHGDELGYLFYDEQLHPSYKGNLTGSKYQDEERAVDRLTTLWTNFAKTSNPTPETNDLITEKWQPITLHNVTYLDIGQSMRLRSGGGSDLRSRIDFWYDLVK